jgi:hypothetical protein
MKHIVGGVISTDQKIWQTKLRERGYKAEICNGYDEAKIVVDAYLREGR